MMNRCQKTLNVFALAATVIASCTKSDVGTNQPTQPAGKPKTVEKTFDTKYYMFDVASNIGPIPTSVEMLDANGNSQGKYQINQTGNITFNSYLYFGDTVSYAFVMPHMRGFTLNANSYVETRQAITDKTKADTNRFYKPVPGAMAVFNLPGLNSGQANNYQGQLASVKATLQ